VGWPKLWNESQRDWAVRRLLQLKFGCWGVKKDDPIGWCGTHGCYVDHCPDLPPPQKVDADDP
jgi:hypothetical protein